MPELKLLRRLYVDIDALESAFENPDPDASWYLDTETGAVVCLSDNALRHARCPSDEPMSPRMARAAAKARRILKSIGTRYLPIPQDDPSDAWQDMQAFLPQVADAKLRRRLRDALRRKDAGRRFRALLYDTVGMDEWYIFQQERLRERIVDWLAFRGIGAWFDEY